MRSATFTGLDSANEAVPSHAAIRRTIDRQIEVGDMHDRTTLYLKRTTTESTATRDEDEILARYSNGRMYDI